MGSGGRVEQFYLLRTAGVCAEVCVYRLFLSVWAKCVAGRSHFCVGVVPVSWPVWLGSGDGFVVSLAGHLDLCLPGGR